ncbi:hypothetical protein H8S95_15515 [Pontibacter sp. KCTC 32443]|uniref:hypothetical protein n=1 Tax=Pontibacter TaxID=323449 RepID=UPI00164D07B6|nr:MULTISPECIES: hypothetical protein [Pontibacter]MBC5775485.1 hypothetical protein [Pontibacter sp. KCTC 32443]
MKTVLIILTCLFYQSAFAQFAIISDKDGFVNIRSSPKDGNNISGKLLNGEVVFCFKGGNTWLPIDYDLSRENKSGYIHKTRLRFIQNFTKVPCQVLTDSNAIFKTDSLTIRITKVPFNPKNNKLQFHKGDSSNNETSYLEKVNGKEIWGTDGNIPKKQYGQILLQLGKDKIYLPVENLYEPNLDYTSVTIDSNKTIYLSALNSDGAGGYAVLWIIEKGRFKKRITTIPF